MEIKNHRILSFLESVEYLKRHFVNPEKYIPHLFKKRVGYELNLQNPRSFNEKMQWLKLFYYNPLYSKLVDKYEVKQYVSNTIGEEYIIPTIGLWNKFEDIDFEQLPNQFVLKCTHDSGGLIICKDKRELNMCKAKRKINKSLRHNYYYMGFEWVYKDVVPRIIAEQYMEDNATKDLRDYKFFVFNGVVKSMFLVTGRDVETHDARVDFFDEHFKHLAFSRGYKNADSLPEKPSQFEKMKELAERLANGIPFVRVDFYEVDGKIYFGEMTFFPGNGMEKFDPEAWDYKFGEWLQLPKPNR